MRALHAWPVTLVCAVLVTGLANALLLLRSQPSAAADPAGPVVAGIWVVWGVVAVHTVAALVCVMLSYRLLRRSQAACQGLAAQVEDLGRARFTELPQPAAPELHALAKALNVAAARLREQFMDREHRLGLLRERVDRDPVTGLGSAAYFDLQLQEQLGVSNAAGGGAMALLRVHDLMGLNRSIGRDRADELLCAVANLLKVRLPPLGQQASLAHISGADFAVLAPGVAAGTFGQWLTHLARALERLGADQRIDRPNIGWLGATTFFVGEAGKQVMNRGEAMLQACEQARAPWKLTTAGSSLQSLAIGEWRLLIESALDTGRILLQSDDVLTLDGALLHRQVRVRMRLPDGRELVGENVLSAAVRTNRTVDVDLRVVGLALVQIAAHGTPMAVQVSRQSVSRPVFSSRLAKLLDAAGQDALRLSLEVDESVLLEGRDDLLRLAALLSVYGVRLGIVDFRNRLVELHGLGALDGLRGAGGPRVHYIKIDASCWRRAGDGGGQRFIELCLAICQAERMKVIACGADTEPDLALVQALKLDGYSRRVEQQDHASLEAA